MVVVGGDDGGGGENGFVPTRWMSSMSSSSVFVFAIVMETYRDSLLRASDSPWQTLTFVKRLSSPTHRPCPKRDLPKAAPAL